METILERQNMDVVFRGAIMRNGVFVTGEQCEEPVCSVTSNVGEDGVVTIEGECQDCGYQFEILMTPRRLPNG